MIENIVIIDTETTGLSPAKGSKIIEIAAVLFNLKHKVILQSYATLLPCETNPVEHINHISAEATKCDYSLIKLDDILMSIVDKAQVCVAHHKKFDMDFVGLLSCGKHILNKRWICTKADFKWPVTLQRYRLEDICNAMRVPYINAHRALIDCLMLAQCFQRVEDLEDRFNKM